MVSMAAPLSFSKTGSFASPPRNGFALYRMSSITSIFQRTLGATAKTTYFISKKINWLSPALPEEHFPESKKSIPGLRRQG
jgi:hypothetical protein